MKHFLKLTYPEAKAVMLSLAQMVEDVDTMAKDTRIPWNPEAREIHREMLASGRSAMRKISEVTGIPLDLEPYRPGDEDEFLTKQS